MSKLHQKSKKFLLFGASVITTFASGNSIAAEQSVLVEASPSPSLEILHIEPWQKWPLLFEINGLPLLLSTFSPPIAMSFDVLYMPSPDWAIGLGSGGLIPSEQDRMLFLSAQGRYYLPHSWVMEPLGFPFSRLYLESRVGLNLSSDNLNPVSEFAGARFFIIPQLGLETRLGSLITHVAGGFTLIPTDRRLDIQPLLGIGLGGGISFEPDSADYQAAIQQLNAVSPAPSFRMTYGLGIPEGLGWTSWLMSPEWGIGFFNGSAGGQERQLGFLLRHYDKPQRFGGMGYFEGVVSTGLVPAIGVRWGYEFHPAEWASLEASIGPGLSGPWFDAKDAIGLPGGVMAPINFLPMLSVALSLTLPLPVATPLPE